MIEDKLLWIKAKRRVSFKRFLFFYFVLIISAWCYWYFNDNIADGGVPWPIFPTFLLAPIIVILYFRAYVLFGKSAIEKEYDRLKSKQV